jgi:predicted outer membrane repeat protein
MKNTLLLIVFILFVTSNTIAGTIKVTSSADSGTGSLREAIAKAASNDIIVFDENITTIYFSGIIKLDKNIIINGNETSNTIFQDAAIWMDTANKKRFFEISKNGELTLNHLTLKDHIGNCSGGTILNYGKLTLNNCTFSNNRAYDIGGVILSYGNLNIEDCTFNNNYAPINGGAIQCYGEGIIANSRFSKNSSEVGGGIYVGIKTIAFILNCIFEENSSQSRGVIDNYGQTTVENCEFKKNNKNAIYNSVSFSNQGEYDGKIILTACVFTEKRDSDTGVFRNFGGDAVIINCSFYKNTTSVGGIIENINNGTLSLINSTIVDNIGTGLLTQKMPGASNNQANIKLYNNIFWGNKAYGAGYSAYDILLQSYDGIITVSNNIFSTSNINLIGNNNLIGEDPLFVTNGYSLQEGSPAIDAGSNVYLTDGVTKDLAGNPRIRNNTVDMGAYEFQGGSSTAIESASAITTKIYTRPHTIIVENAISPVSIYNLTGQLIIQGAQTEFSVPTAGIYIVRVGNVRQKVLVW